MSEPESPTTYRLGVISMRHDMPVSEYLVQEVTPGQAAYDQVYAALAAWLEAHPGVGRRPELPLEIYYSGLTEATLAVVDGLANHNCRHSRLMRFDMALREYEPLIRRVADGQSE